MSFASELHLHTVMSDGKSDAREYVKKAEALGFCSLGFSDHSFTDFDTSFCMKKADEEKYFEQISALKEEFAGKIELYAGIEYDAASDPAALSKYDYVIGACHYVPTAEGKRCVDLSESYTAETVEKYFRGDHYAYCKKYFGEVAKLADIPEVDIVAHFDLVTKFNEGEKYFSETHPKFVMPALVAIERLCAAGKIFEINTGAVTRGYKTSAYPSALLLSSIYELGGKITFARDAHEAAHLDTDFENAKALAKECGFECAYMLVGGKFIAVEI